MKKYFGVLALVLIACSVWLYIQATSAPFISLFPIEHYDQHLSHWINPNDSQYDKLLLSKEQQNKRFDDWQRRHYGDLSPWDMSAIKAIISQKFPQDAKSFVIKFLDKYSNEKKPARKIGYGANFRPLPASWIEKLQRNCNLAQFDAMTANPSRRAITIANTHARDLPTEDVHFYHYTYAGEGYPFDNLQAAALWAGTPVYILGETLARDWLFVQTPYFKGWIKSTDIARVDDAFINQWRQAAAKQTIAITDTQIPIIDEETNNFSTTGYIGMAFPAEKNANTWRIMISVRDEQGLAKIHHALIPETQASAMPIAATPRHFVAILDKLIGRTYGWGGMYFYNDCASEIKNIFVPFGIWVPNHSSYQVDSTLYSVKTIDLSKLDPKARIDYMMKAAHPFMTIVYMPGHVTLYLGTYPNPDDPQHHPVPLSYQDIWAEEPPNNDRRSVIGGSVLLPMIPYYPEDPSLVADAAEKVFILGTLD